ncbi:MULTISPECIES: nitroreductase family protein [Morganella]|uniref:Nitroreductase family protein n=1 Tax=Morganella morganii TaxID=582 RepID=A0A9Q4CP01_MORMO|nr:MULTISPECIES: nitroreductase family protein [Morganella]BEP19997.1 nitroreductase family protein [Morganella morganii subsp. sibonii]HAE76521.1 nitroreductase [Morganella sp. (in: enterobacteria)]EGT3623648.1 nitroreductase family protein [Morganella morganii]EGT3629186.1 nitroreductase family protein [Morganella morganii]EGT3635802.1 nitroreductase family protein [Morganella morganii]
MSNSFIELIKKRRTIYSLGNNLPVSQDRIAALIKEAVKHSPTAFNSQSSRVVVLFGENHKKLWNIVKDALRAIVPADAFAATESKIDNAFLSGAGTVLFFEDQSVVKGLQEQFALYADNFPVWSEQASGIAQFAVWTALSEENIGASLQHYNPVIDEQVSKAWDIPADWKLRAQLVFGSIEQEAGEKAFIDDESRFRIFN